MWRWWTRNQEKKKKDKDGEYKSKNIFCSLKLLLCVTIKPYRPESRHFKYVDIKILDPVFNKGQQDNYFFYGAQISAMCFMYC